MTWVMDKGNPDQPIDRPYTHYNRLVATTPANVLVPMYAGERVIDSVAGKQYQAMGLTAGTWVDCGVMGPD